jgi:hypothetical protein
MTPSCGLEVQKTTQAFNSATDPNNTFDLISKCKTTVMPLTDFSAWVGLYTSSAQHDVKYQI